MTPADRRGGEREERVEQVREVDALCLGDEAEQGTVAVEAPRTPSLGDLERGLSVAVQDLRAQSTVGELVGQLNRVRAVPFRADNRGKAGWHEAPHDSPGREQFKLGDAETLLRRERR